MLLEDVFLSFFFYPPAHVGPIVPVFLVAKLTPRHWSCHEVSEKSWQRDSAIPKLPSILPQQNKKERRQRVKVVLSADVDFWTMKWILHWIWFFFLSPSLSPPATQCLAHRGCFHQIGLHRQGRSYIFGKDIRLKTGLKFSAAQSGPAFTNIRHCGVRYCKICHRFSTKEIQLQCCW